MLYSEKVSEAIKFLSDKIDQRPEIALILGSGLGSLAESIENPSVIPYQDIPYWPRSTAPGHAGKLIFGTLEGVSTVIMQGRVHYYEGYTMEEVVFPVRVLGRLGIKTLIVTNASGGINTDIPPGGIVAIQDHINFMGTNPLIGENDDEMGPRFPDMSEAYDREYIQKLESAAEKENISLNRGTYIAFSGPSFETPAEIRMAGAFGADVVGMSTVPEVITANHMGIRVCGISCVANAAAGISKNKLTHQEVLDTMKNSSATICRLISAFLREIRE
ncbi:MAG: purine-nucleoside phosphorylase [Synergistaceae bacterium]|nr:purine-nucleoside phosphorylase [Synergistaceae bacterium]